MVVETKLDAALNEVAAPEIEIIHALEAQVVAKETKAESWYSRNKDFIIIVLIAVVVIGVMVFHRLAHL